MQKAIQYGSRRAATIAGAMLLLAVLSGGATAQNIATFAGNGLGTFAGDGGAATAASLNGPHGMAVDANGNAFIADRNNARVRRVDVVTGVITTVAGNGTSGYTGDGGQATAATLRTPESVAVFGNLLYIADSSSDVVRRVNLSTGIISTVAGTGVFGQVLGDGGQATAAGLSIPVAVAVDTTGNLYITDWGHFRIRKVVVATGVISTVAGNGTSAFTGDGFAATTAGLNAPEGIALDGAGNLYIADTGHSRIRRVAPGLNGIITTIAGNGSRTYAGDGGPATSASLFDPVGVAVDGTGAVYIGDTGNNRIRKVTGSSINTYAGDGTSGFLGDGGLASAARISSPRGLAVDALGNVYIADFNNDRVRRVALLLFQTISFPTLPAATRLPGSSVTVAATASSGLAVVFSSTTPSICTVAGALVSLNAAGVCTIAADQPGNATYGPAPRVTQNILVGTPGAIPQTIAFTPFPVGTYLVGQSVGAAATATSGLAVTFSSLTPATCSVAGATVTLQAPGACTVAANQAGNATFLAALQATQGLLVSPAGTFTFIDQTLAPLASVLTSNTVTITGVAVPVPIAVAGGTYSIGCNGVFTATPATIASGQTVCVRHTTATLPGVATDTTLTVGGISDTFTSTTAASNAASYAAGYYRSILRREPDAGGLAFWESEALRMQASGANAVEAWRAMAIYFFNSAEYRSFNRNDAQFLADLYRTFLRREPEPDGLAYWGGEITAGLPREIVLLSFLFSPEFATITQNLFGAGIDRAEVSLVIDFYRGLMNRLPDPGGLDYWLGRFRAAQCTSPQAVIAEVNAISALFLASAEYLGRARSNVQYVSDLYQVFLRRGGDLAGVKFWENELNTLARTREQLRVNYLASPEFQVRLNAVVARGCAAP